MNPIAFAALAWEFYFVYIGCLVVFLVLIYFLFPETKGRTLEEIAVVFDGQTEPWHPSATDVGISLDVCEKSPSKVEAEYVA